MTKASTLRNKENLNAIAAASGYYKWWAARPELDVILNALGVSFNEVSSALETNEDLFCVYIGIAAKGSVRARLNWHVNDPHTALRVKNGTLSTFRQSIASVVARNQYDKDATDSFIDKLYVEWFCIDKPIKSAEAKFELRDMERRLLMEHLRVLNIQENKHPLAVTIKSKLKQLRKISKEE